MELRTLKEKFVELSNTVVEIESLINISNLKFEISEIEAEFSNEGFWDDHRLANSKSLELRGLKHKLNLYLECSNILEEVEVAIELLSDHHDEKLYLEAEVMLSELFDKKNKLYNLLLLNDEFDKNNAIVDIHAGAGGTEAQDWVEMLFRMYTRFCNKNSYKLKVIDFHAGDPVGVKSVAFEIEGVDVYGHLKSERGVHRLIRISPFDSSGKRHTTFASVDVVPILEDSEDIVIEKSDLKIDTYRASGAGGQSVNTTDSAVRITHIPTGIIVSCQNERSQVQNKEYAMKILKNKLVAHAAQMKQSILDNNAEAKAEIGWGSQIRSYVFQPYAMVKDHRTNTEVGNVKAVLDGEIDEFIVKYLEYINKF